MDLKQLQYFVITAKMRSITDASKQLDITSAALSLSLKRLEDEMGIILFERKHQGVEITDAGAEFLITAARILKKIEYLKFIIKSSSKDLSGKLNILSTPIIEKFFLPIIKDLYLQLYPGVDVSIKIHPIDEVLSKISKNKSQLGFFISLDNNEKIEDLSSFYNVKITPFLKFKINVCVSKKSDLAKKKKIDFKTLTNLDIILYKDELNKTTFIKEMLDNFNIGENVKFLKNVDFIEEVVQKELCVFLTPSINDRIVNLISLKKFVYLPLENAPEFYAAYVTSDNQEMLNPNISAFTQLLPVEFGYFQ